MSDLEAYIREKFVVDPSVFLQALKLSPNAQGYIGGAITEFVLRDMLVADRFEVKRIREKWDGRKHPNHRGDFYIRRDGSDWYVLESKGVKSNSEKWHGLYNRDKLATFLNKWRVLTPFRDEGDVERYIRDALPKFDAEFSAPMYSNREISNYTPGARSTAKKRRIEELRNLGALEVERQIAERVQYVRERINVVETHFVSGGSSVGERTQATPRADEFNILSLDLFLRTGDHDLVYVDPTELARSPKDPDHLQQNYVVDILLTDLKPKPDPQPPWSTDIDEVFAALGAGVQEADMQVDQRSLEEIAEDVNREERV